ncbi:MAG: 50S ribosomal protein L9 [Proteobacteria bacterium]|nr:50S ribosomal protein L9 [Cystobacterineae bacterium]MCL2314327.1 50S ribosomal protein L9 [Pseudomonadota bacterium]
MKIILREDVPKLGKSGELLNVKDGFARNYLLPRKLAVVANASNVRQLEHEKTVIALHQRKIKNSAESLAGQLSHLNLKVVRKVGEQGRLYGSVTTLDISDALAAKGFEIERRAIHLPEPIKTAGSFEIELRLHKDVHVQIKLDVVDET